MTTKDKEKKYQNLINIDGCLSYNQVNFHLLDCQAMAKNVLIPHCVIIKKANRHPK